MSRVSAAPKFRELVRTKRRQDDVLPSCVSGGRGETSLYDPTMLCSPQAGAGWWPSDKQKDEIGRACMAISRGYHFFINPGPTNIPDRVLRAMDRGAIDFNGAQRSEEHTS